MRARCPRCEEHPPERGVLCAACADALGSCDGLLPEHLVSTVALGQGWLIDVWGQPHPVASDGTIVGRLLKQSFAIFQPSVSRQHAEMTRDTDGWLVRDFGSKNGTFVHGERVRGRGRLEHRDLIQFGSVPFYFLDRAVSVSVRDGRSILTESAIDCGFRSQLIRKPGGDQAVQLVEVDGRGVLLFRKADSDDWSEMNLAPLEFQLLRALADRRQKAHLDAEASVMTKELADSLSFRSQYANEENVRQVVKRLRLALRQLGITDLIRSAPRQGYSVAWEAEEWTNSR